MMLKDAVQLTQFVVSRVIMFPERKTRIKRLVNNVTWRYIYLKKVIPCPLLKKNVEKSVLVKSYIYAL